MEFYLIKNLFLIALISSSSVIAAELAIKATTVQFDYMETFAGTNIDSEKSSFGEIKGFEVSIRGGGYNSSGVKLINTLDFSHSKGDTQYVGSFLNDPNGKYGDLKSISSNKLTELSYMLGVSFPVSCDFSIGGQLGTGARSWERNLNDGNIETYFWGIFSAGSRMDWKLFPGVEFSTTADYQKAYKPTMESTLIASSFDLGKTDGYKIGLHWVGNITQRLAFEMDYVYDYWKITKSNSIVDGFGNVYFEPDSKTKNSYVKAGLAYEF